MTDETKDADSSSHALDQAALLSLVKEGKEAWNQWAESNPGATVDFSNVGFESRTYFQGFQFPGPANFRDAKFGSPADFRDAKFGSHADFSDAEFEGPANFSDVKFGGLATFNEAKFGNHGNFNDTKFGGYANFSDTKFEGYANFSDAKFEGYANFSDAKFGGYAAFIKAKFESYAKFNDAKFGGDTRFHNAQFGGDAAFIDVQFGGDAYFTDAQFEDYAAFRGAQFSAITSFGFVNLDSRFDLTNSTFRSIPDFQSTKNTGFIVLSNSKFSLGQPLGIIGRIIFVITGIRVTDEDTVSRIRYLRGIASKTYSIDVERDLNILERNAQIGVAWSELKQWSGFKRWSSHLLTAIKGIMQVLYRFTSWYGLSVVLPFIWLFGSTYSFGRLYVFLYEYVRFLYPEAKNVSSSILDFTITSMVPFGSNVRPTYQIAVDSLFPAIVQTLPNGQILLEGRVPAIFQLVSLTQGVLTLIFVFLIGLALRNFFRMK